MFSTQTLRRLPGMVILILYMFFSQREFEEGLCVLSEGRIYATFAILYFPFNPTQFEGDFLHTDYMHVKKTDQNRLYFGRTTKSTLQHHSNLTTLQYCCNSVI